MNIFIIRPTLFTTQSIKQIPCKFRMIVLWQLTLAKGCKVRNSIFHEPCIHPSRSALITKYYLCRNISFYKSQLLSHFTFLSPVHFLSLIVVILNFSLQRFLKKTLVSRVRLMEVIVLGLSSKTYCTRSRSQPPYISSGIWVSTALKAALRQLGYQNIYHMEALFKNPDHVPKWIDASKGKYEESPKEQWDDLLGEYDVNSRLSSLSEFSRY